MNSVTRLTSLRTERLDNGHRKLLSPVLFQVSVDGFETIVTVPQGFVTDFSSLPALVRLPVNWVKVDIAGLIHDFLYDSVNPYNLPRQMKDEIWKITAESGTISVSSTVARIMYYGLRMGGASRDMKKYFPLHDYFDNLDIG
jgi:hypothetical protein